jgi:winged helix-turn helix protein
METFTMSRKEVPRAGLVKAAVDGNISNREGARALRLSVRQFKRLKARFRAGGEPALLHRGRGRISRRRLRPEVRKQIVRLMTKVYEGFNDVHLTEKLQECHALPISRASVRRLRVALGGPARHRRRAAQHRSRRERAPAPGQLVQLDASPFAWFEDRGPQATLHGLIDDATSIPLGLWFRPTEDLHGYLTVLGQTCRAYGCPVTLYGDRASVFRRNDQHWSLAEQLRGEQDPTHFGRVLRDLGIGFIAAQSPQAKGRIERLWGTLQDRLVSELRLRKIATLAAANAFLPAFLADFRPRFACAPATTTPAWRSAPRELDRVLSCRYARIVARDNTVRLASRWIQVPPGPGGRSYAGCRVDVRELLDGRVMVFYQHVLLVTHPAPGPDFTLTPRRSAGDTRAQTERQQRRRTRQLTRALTALATAARPRRSHAPLEPASTAARSSRPAPTHPWRGRFRRNGPVTHPPTR